MAAGLTSHLCTLLSIAILNPLLTALPLFLNGPCSSFILRCTDYPLLGQWKPASVPNLRLLVIHRAGSAPLILPCTSQWWAIVQRSGSSWSARSSLLGPLLEQPSVASRAYSSGSNTLRLQVRLGADAPTGAVLYYKVWQRVLLGRNLILNGSSVTLQGVDTAVVATSSGGLLTVTFDVELFVSADGFETSDTAEFTYVYGDIT